MSWRLLQGPTLCPFGTSSQLLFLWLFLTARCWPQATMSNTSVKAISQWEVCELTFNDTTTSLRIPFWDPDRPGPNSQVRPPSTIRCRASIMTPFSMEGQGFAPNTQGTWQFLRHTKKFQRTLQPSAAPLSALRRRSRVCPYPSFQSPCVLLFRHHAHYSARHVGHTPAVTAALLGISLRANGVPAHVGFLQLYGVNTYRI